jgi:hypothetical protein
MGLTKNLGTLAQGVFSDSSLNIGIGGAPSGSFKFEVTGTGKFSGALTAANINVTGSAIPANGMYLSAANTLNFATNSTNRFSISSTGAATFTVGITTNSTNTFNGTGVRAIDSTSTGVQFASQAATHSVIFGDKNSRLFSLFTPSGAATMSIRNHNTSTDMLTFVATGEATFASSIAATSATFSGVLTAGSSSSQTPASISTNSQANQPALTLFKNIFTGTGEDVFRIQSFNSGVVNVFTVKDNGATALSGALLGTSATFSGNVTANNGSVFVAASSLGTVFTVMQSDNTAGYLGTNSNHPLVLRTDSTERMRISSTGAATFKVGTNENVSISSVGGGDMRISALNDAVSATVQLSIQGSPLLFRTFGGVEAMRITSGGNVGIGTTSPTSFGTGYTVLTVNGSNAGILNTQCNGIDALRFSSESTITYMYEPRNVPITIWTNATERMRITSSGNVLVGTTTDAGYKFQVNGQSNLDGYNLASSFQFTRAASNLVTPASGNGILVFAGGNAQMRMDTANQICFDMNNGGNPHTVLTLKQSDNTVSINSPNNNLPLELKYQNVASGYLGASGSALYAYSTNGGYVLLNASSVWVAASDAKRKRNFETYSNGLSAILGLQPKLYNMDFQKDGDEKQVGLVAQEVKDFIPKAYEDNNNFIGLNYNAIIVTMINAIKELKAEIDILKNN